MDKWVKKVSFAACNIKKSEIGKLLSSGDRKVSLVKINAPK